MARAPDRSSRSLSGPSQINRLARITWTWPVRMCRRRNVLAGGAAPGVHGEVTPGADDRAEPHPLPAGHRVGLRPDRLAGEFRGQQRRPARAQAHELRRGAPQPADRGQNADHGGDRGDRTGRVHRVPGHRVRAKVRGAVRERGPGQPERPQDQAGHRLGVRDPGDVGDELAERGVAPVAGPDRPPRAAAGHHRAGDADQVRNVIGEELGLFGAVHPRGMGEQLADCDRGVLEAHGGDQVIDRGVEGDPALGDETQHGRGREQGRAAVGWPAVRGPDQLTPVQIAQPW